MIRKTCLLALMLFVFPATARGQVVINEIFYHAPDELEDLEFIELYNAGEQPADLGGWEFTKGIRFSFAAGTTVESKGFLVLCRNRARFLEFYDVPVFGTFNQKLSNKGERIELHDAHGRVVEGVKYQDTAPWPKGSDGFSGSLERINPETSGQDFFNWASSPLSEDRLKPAGTPGKVNANFSVHSPPIISDVQFAPKDPSPDQPIAVEADVRAATGKVEVNLLFRLAGPGFEKPEVSVPMIQKSEGRYSATIPGQAARQLIRFRVSALETNGAKRLFPSETEPRPALSLYVPGPIEPAQIPFGWIINTTESEFNATQPRPSFSGRGRFRGPGGFLGGRGGPGRFGGARSEPTSNRSAFVYFDPGTGRHELFDFVQVEPRKAGRKVRFYSDQPLNGMKTINLIFESESAALAEPLAYEVYRRSGVATEESYHIRLWLNDQPAGYHLLVEQPNRAFLRRHNISDDGNLYKILWYEQGIVGQHEKKTNVREGHDDIVAVINTLNSTKGDAQWDVIKTSFDVLQVANYFAASAVLSNWDGFFNNYFTYHDINGTGKWTMYPWDEDQTWGITMGFGQVFYDMPITFGMDGDQPPGAPGGNGGRRRGFGFGGFGFGGGGAPWWRGPGWFSGPLLANPQFRKFFLSRTREILETVYTEENFVPIINAMGERLKPEVEFQATLSQADPVRAVQSLERNLQALRDHVKKRREFLLAQDEVKNAEKYSQSDLGASTAKP